MKIELAGSKPHIDERGITFKDGKEDKFIYIPYAIDLLKALEHDYTQNKKNSSQIDHKNLSGDEIIAILKKYYPNLEDTINKEIKNYETHLDDEEKHVDTLKTLSQIEKDAFVGNLRIMREYKTKRAINKILYFHCLDAIVDTIIKYKIKGIDTPFNGKFWHILQTLEGELSKHRIGSKLKSIEENNSLKVVLSINL